MKTPLINPLWSGSPGSSSVLLQNFGWWPVFTCTSYEDKGPQRKTSLTNNPFVWLNKKKKNVTIQAKHIGDDHGTS